MHQNAALCGNGLNGKIFANNLTCGCHDEISCLKWKNIVGKENADLSSLSSSAKISFQVSESRRYCCKGLKKHDTYQ